MHRYLLRVPVVCKWKKFLNDVVDLQSFWRLVRVVEGARLESVYTGNCIKGSNPLVSAEISYFKEGEISLRRCSPAQPFFSLVTNN